MKTEMILTPVVAHALEERRRQLDSELDPIELINQYECGGHPGFRSDVAKIDLLGNFKERCRELGALDQVCEQYGITDFVMRERGEE